MTANKPTMNQDSAMHSKPDDDLPDLTSPHWQAKFAKAEVKRGRPISGKTKVLTSIRLDPEVIEAFKAQGRGWQSRMNDALRTAAGLD